MVGSPRRDLRGLKGEQLDREKSCAYEVGWSRGARKAGGFMAFQGSVAALRMDALSRGRRIGG